MGLDAVRGWSDWEAWVEWLKSVGVELADVPYVTRRPCKSLDKNDQLPFCTETEQPGAHMPGARVNAAPVTDPTHAGKSFSHGNSAEISESQKIAENKE